MAGRPTGFATHNPARFWPVTAGDRSHGFRGSLAGTRPREHSVFHEKGGVLDYALTRVGPAAGCHSGLLRCSVKDENMMLKLMLILSSSLALASTECCR
jgi:hypothetical protein